MWGLRVMNFHDRPHVIMHQHLFCVCRSLGCTVVEMLSGKPPWHEYEGIAVVYLIGTSDKPKYTLPDSVSDIARVFLERCFIHDPLHRPSACELLSDPFVCNVLTL